MLRVLIGLLMFFGGMGGFSYSLTRLIHTGTCASGNTPYVIGRQCPSGTGAMIGLLAGSIFGVLIGIGVAGLGLALLGGLAFTIAGAVAVYAGATSPSGNGGGALGGYIVGGVFVVMGLAYVAFGISSWRSSRDHSKPTLTAVGLSQLIAATAPKPIRSDKLSEDEQPEKGG